jgi:uncharacterized membrane protein YoaK (UPF0700 family)
MMITSNALMRCRWQLLLLTTGIWCCKWHYAFPCNPLSRTLSSSSTTRNGRLTTTTTPTPRRRRFYSPFSSSQHASALVTSNNLSESTTTAGSILWDINPTDNDDDDAHADVVTVDSLTTSSSPLLSSSTRSSDQSLYQASDDPSSVSFFQLSLPTPAATPTSTGPIRSLPNNNNNNNNNNNKKNNNNIIISNAQDRLDTRFLIAMMAMAGYVEGFCLVTYKTFPNMMTGNTVKLVEAILYGRWNKMVYYSTIILLYMMGGSIFVQWKDYAQKKTITTTTTNTLTSSSSPPPTTSTVTSTTTQPMEMVEYRSILTRGVALLTMGILMASDLIGGGTKAIRLPLLGMAFGLLHAYTIDLIGVVPFAMTGHLTKIGIGLTKDYVLMKEKPAIKNQAFDHTSPSTSSTTSTSSPHRYNPKGYTTSIWGLLAFMGMAMLANIVLALAGQSIRLYTALQSHMGMTLAVSYGLLLRWYHRQNGNNFAALNQQQSQPMS